MAMMQQIESYIRNIVRLLANVRIEWKVCTLEFEVSELPRSLVFLNVTM